MVPGRGESNPKVVGSRHVPEENTYQEVLLICVESNIQKYIQYHIFDKINDRNVVSGFMNVLIIIVNKIPVKINNGTIFFNNIVLCFQNLRIYI